MFIYGEPKGRVSKQEFAGGSHVCESTHQMGRERRGSSERGSQNVPEEEKIKDSNDSEMVADLYKTFRTARRGKDRCQVSYSALTIEPSDGHECKRTVELTVHSQEV